MPSATPALVSGSTLPKILHENRIFRVSFNGYYHYLDFKFPAGAIVIPRFNNGDLLLVRLRRAPNIGYSVEFPRGGVEQGETPEEGASRELCEETGYRVALPDLVHLGQVGPDTATINGFNQVYLAEIPEGAEPASYDTEEIDSLLRVSLAQLNAMVVRDEITCGQTLAALMKLMVRQ